MSRRRQNNHKGTSECTLVPWGAVPPAKAGVNSGQSPRDLRTDLMLGLIASPRSSHEGSPNLAPPPIGGVQDWAPRGQKPNKNQTQQQKPPEDHGRLSVAGLPSGLAPCLRQGVLQASGGVWLVVAWGWCGEQRSPARQASTPQRGVLNPAMLASSRSTKRQSGPREQA